MTKRMRLIISEKAMRDAEQASDYYQEISLSLRKAFQQEFKRSYKHITNVPYYAIKYGEVRCYNLNRFPYMLHYTVDETSQTLNLLGVIHTGRDPEDSWHQ